MSRRRLTVVVLILLILGGGALVVAKVRADMKRAPIQAAEAFFKDVAAGNLYDAFRATASVIRGENFEKFERSILDSGLDQYASGTWRLLRRGTGNEERLQGEIRTHSGEERPFTLSVVREAGRWRVFSVVSEQRGSVFRGPGEVEEAPATPAGPPTEQQARALVLDTLLRFNEAVQIRFFGPFYQQVSVAWQNQTSPEDLQRAFAAFIENRISFGSLARAEPVFTTPVEISPEGLLSLNGDCGTETYTVRFSMRYLHERGKWRLFGIDLNLLPPRGAASGTPPTYPAPTTGAASPAPAVPAASPIQ
jgi:hypothetical protein